MGILEKQEKHQVIKMENTKITKKVVFNSIFQEQGRVEKTKNRLL